MNAQRSTKPWADRIRVASALRNEHVRIGERPGVGRAVFAARPFAVGECVASYQGRIVTRAALIELFTSDRALFERITEYGFVTPSGDHLFNDASVVGAHLINHSCGPNAKWAEWERGALLVRAVRPIAEGEEITTHYGWLGVKAAVEKNWHKCACSSPFCAGTIELRLEWWQGAQGAGPRLPEEEVVRRLLADIANDTDENEGLLLHYGQGGSLEMTLTAEVVAAIDPGAFLEKMEACARVAVRAALRVREQRVSMRRLRQIAKAYHVSLEGVR